MVSIDVKLLLLIVALTIVVSVMGTLAALQLVAVAVRRRRERLRIRKERPPVAPSPTEAEQTVQIPRVPSFGTPRRAVYYAREYVEPLLCAGTGCGHAMLQDGQEFYDIPLPSEGPDAALAVCLPCAHRHPFREDLRG